MTEKEIELLKEQMKNLENRVSKLEELTNVDSNFFVHDINLDKICKSNSIEISHLANIFHIEKEEIVLLKYSNENDLETSKITQNISLLFLWGYKFLLSKEDISPTLIKEMIEYHGISIQNFSKYISEIIPHLVIRKGSSPKNYSYKLTIPGIEKASKLINEITSD